MLRNVFKRNSLVEPLPKASYDIHVESKRDADDDEDRSSSDSIEVREPADGAVPQARGVRGGGSNPKARGVRGGGSNPKARGVRGSGSNPKTRGVRGGGSNPKARDNEPAEDVSKKSLLQRAIEYVSL